MRITLLLLIPSVLGAVNPAPVDVNTLFARGQAAFAAGDMPAARAYYSQACSGPGSDTVFARAICEHVYGVLENSEAHYRKALTAWDQLAPQYPDFHANTLICLADLLSAARRSSEAETLLRGADGIAVSPAVRAAVSGHLGALYARSGESERGRTLLSEALTRLEALQPAPRHELAYAYNALGTMDLDAGRYPEGEATIRKALALEEKPEYETNLAAAFQLEGRLEWAENLLHRVKIATEARYGQESLESAVVLSNLSVIESSRGKFGTAEDLSERALAIFRHERGADSLDAVSGEVSLAAVYLRQHKTAEAARTQPDEPRLEQFLKPDPRLLADGIRQLADLRAQQHRWKESDALYRKAIDLYAQRLGPNHPDLAEIRRDYAAMAKAGRLSRPNQT